jgi:hypothetical protein
VHLRSEDFGVEVDDAVQGRHEDGEGLQASDCQELQKIVGSNPLSKIKYFLGFNALLWCF